MRIPADAVSRSGHRVSANDDSIKESEGNLKGQ